MSTSSATPPATRRIAKSYLTDLVAAIPDIGPEGFGVAPVVDQLLGHAQVRHVLRSDQLVLTFDLADDPAGWTTPAPAAALGGAAAGAGENRDYPGQPATEGDPWTAPIAGNVEVRDL